MMHGCSESGNADDSPSSRQDEKGTFQDSSAEVSRRRAISLVTVYAGTLVSFGGLAWGLDLGSISGALGGARREFALSPSEVGWFVGLMSLGELVGATASGLLSDWIGRRWSLALSDIMYAASSAALATAQSKYMLFAARFGSGIAVGSSLVAQVTWASEIAPSTTRGTVTATFELAISAGFVCSFAVFAAMPTASFVWRLLFGLPCIPALVQLACVAFAAPESPHWLAANGKGAEAKAQLKRIYEVYGRNAAAAPPLEDISDDEHESDESCYTAWCAWRLPWACVVFVTWLTFFTGGFNLRIFVTDVLKAAGLSTQTAAVVTLVLGIVKFVTTAFAVAFVDSLGRKPLLDICLILTAACALGVSFLFGAGAATWLVAPLACVYTVAFQLGFGTCNFVLAGELFPPHLKGRLVTAVKFPGALFQFVTQYLFAIAAQRARTLALLFGVHALCALLGLAFVAFVLVESNNKDPYQIKRELAATPAATALARCCSRRTHFKPTEAQSPAPQAARAYRSLSTRSTPCQVARKGTTAKQDDDINGVKAPSSIADGATVGIEPSGSRVREEECRALV